MDTFDFLAFVGVVVLVVSAFTVGAVVGACAVGVALIAVALVLSLAGRRQE